jgi:DNA-binding FadR family transcriptional regulator
MPIDTNKTLNPAGIGAIDQPLSGHLGASSSDPEAATATPMPRSPRRLLRLHGTIARDLGVLIVSGKYQAGEILEGEIEASDRLQVSRGAYREAAALAARRRTEQDLFAMDAALEGMATHTLASEAGQIADQDFHAVLLRAGANPFLISLTSGIGAAVSWTTVFKGRLQPVMRDPVPDHRVVYEAIKAADSVAAHHAMEALLDTALLDTLNARRQAR